ncbi:hypothetical protein [Pseudonocardia sp. DLS-67]
MARPLLVALGAMRRSLRGCENVLSGIDEAQLRLPGDGVTRSAILYVGIEQTDVWLELLGPGRGRRAADTVVTSRRLSRVGLERWSHELHGQFSDPADRDRLLTMTGGWPLLIDSVAAACTRGIGTFEALMLLHGDLEGDLGRELLAATNLRADPRGCRPTDRPTATLAALIAVGAVGRDDDGTLSLEAVLAQLWQMHHG